MRGGGGGGERIGLFYTVTTDITYEDGEYTPLLLYYFRYLGTCLIYIKSLFLSNYREIERQVYSVYSRLNSIN